MKKYAVIVAGGSGQRMGSNVPKQFLLLNGEPILTCTIQAFIQAYDDIKVILVLPEEHTDQGRTLIINMGAGERVQITSGGETRFQSVKNGLKLIHELSIVFVHDGVRCLVTSELIRRCYEQAIDKGSAVPAVFPTDSLRMTEGTEHYVIDRSDVRIIQTPQTFKSNILLPAFNQPYEPSFTDEATVVEAAGNKVYLIDGEYENIKITRPADLWAAEKILQTRLTFKPF